VIRMVGITGLALSLAALDKRLAGIDRSIAIDEN
jgi:hypothetical protein